MKPEKKQLLADLLTEAGRREATLAAAGRGLQRRRQLHRFRQVSGVVLVFGILAGIGTLVLPRPAHHRVMAMVGTNLATPVSAPQAASLAVPQLTDEELLALFPNTPVGLVTLSNGKKLMVFPRPADKARYVARF